MADDKKKVKTPAPAGGLLGGAKAALVGRKSRLDAALDEADPPKKMANGGKVCHDALGGGRKGYGK